MRAFCRLGAALGILLFGTRRRALITAAVFVPALILGVCSTHSTDKRTARVEQQWYEHDKREAERYAHAKPLPTGPVCTTTTKTTTTTKQGGTSKTSSTRKGHHTSSVTNRTPVTSTQTTHERQCK